MCSYAVVYFLARLPPCQAVLCPGQMHYAPSIVCAPSLFLHNHAALLRGLTKQLWRQSKAIHSLWCSKTICHNCNVMCTVRNYLPTITPGCVLSAVEDQSFMHAACCYSHTCLHVCHPPAITIVRSLLGSLLLRGCHHSH